MAQRWGKKLLEFFLKVSGTRRTLSTFFLFGIREETVCLRAVRKILPDWGIRHSLWVNGEETAFLFVMEFAVNHRVSEMESSWRSLA